MGQDDDRVEADKRRHPVHEQDPLLQENEHGIRDRSFDARENERQAPEDEDEDLRIPRDTPHHPGLCPAHSERDDARDVDDVQSIEFHDATPGKVPLETRPRPVSGGTAQFSIMVELARMML